MLTANELRKKYLEFFKSKGHAVIPSFPVIPENDPTGLFINSGMHPLVPYLMGEKHPQGTRLTDSQKCIRTIDIDEVGDNRHLTFFEMLGNWSLGDYFKKEAIEWSWEFLTSKQWLGLEPERIYVTVFAGNENSPQDDVSVGAWSEVFLQTGISHGICQKGEKAQADSRIFLLDEKDNWWGPAGETGPCGPCSEMFYDVRPAEGALKGTHEELVDSFRLMEIWNDVFMEFNKKADGSFEKMAKQNVDTGMGLERTITVLAGKENVFDTELFRTIIEKIEEISGHKYEESEEIKKSMRIIADHIKAAVFIMADGVEPSNNERGYVLRRLIRRAVRQGHSLEIKDNFTVEVAEAVQRMYEDVYPEIIDASILDRLRLEEEKFRRTLEKGLREFESQMSKLKTQDQNSNTKIVSGEIAFNLYQTHGFPLELIIEEASRDDMEVDKKDFEKRLKEHQKLSRTASAGMFKGGLADSQEKTTQLHTAAHLMLAGLRKVLGEHVHQRGSNINGERIRFDFSHGDKMTDEEKKAVEDFVNEAISKKIEVKMKEMPLAEARDCGAEGAFENKYGELVKVYQIEGYSNEICGGPHVKNTGDIQGIFKIKKEQSSSAGVRRIKAVLE
jgi:alanyl-tRNA synthetase